MDELIIDIFGLPPARAGSKAEKLHFLWKEGFNVPKTYVVPWQAHERYKAKDPALMTELRAALVAKIDAQNAYAVRSSADVEDRPEHSFAGQFRSVLNVTGPDEILAAVRSVWDSIDGEKLMAYAGRAELAPEEIRMGVIIQAYVNPAYSGVAFSQNPLTSNSDEVIVEAVSDSGEALLQRGVTPLRWVIASRRLVERPAADSLADDVVLRIAADTARIAKRYGRPSDVEWVYDGERVYWVQLREITGLREANVYSNLLSRELLPGMIKPLVWSINVPLINGAWVRLITEVVGQNDLDPATLARPFYYRTYFNMGALGRLFRSLGMPADFLERVMGFKVGGTIKIKPTAKLLMMTPRTIPFVIDKLTFSRRIDRTLPAAEARYRALYSMDLTSLSDEDVIDRAEELRGLLSEMAYLNIVATLLSNVFNKRLAKRLNKSGLELMSFDLALGEKMAEFDPNPSLRELGKQYDALPEQLKTIVRREGAEGIRSHPELARFSEGFSKLIGRFGHLSNSTNNFSVKAWREEPEHVLGMIVQSSDMGDAPGLYSRREDVAKNLNVFSRWTYHKAREYRLQRERVGYVYAFGYSLFRPYFLELARRFIGEKIIEKADDIFFISYGEIRDILEKGANRGEIAQKVEARRREMELYEDAVVPEVIFNDVPPPVVRSDAARLRGVPTSSGYYVGKTRAVAGMQEFGRVQKGEVLIIPYSDAGWTPLFAKAGAIIAESGGVLSHSSVIGREYGIPVIVSVPGAMGIEDGTDVIVDGYTGEIAIQAPARVAPEIRAPVKPDR